MRAPVSFGGPVFVPGVMRGARDFPSAQLSILLESMELWGQWGTFFRLARSTRVGKTSIFSTVVCTLVPENRNTVVRLFNRDASVSFFRRGKVKNSLNLRECMHCI